MKGTTIFAWMWPKDRKAVTRRLRLAALVMSMLSLLGAVELTAAQPSAAASFVPIDGAGSTWAFNAINAWTTSVSGEMTVNYTANGSTSGRNFFKNGTSDWAQSEIPYGVRDGNNFDPPPARGYAYIPDVAGGTTFMYNLAINGQRVTNLRLSGAVIAAIFTNKITKWNDPRIKADNPDLALPPTPIVPVVRSDGSGATAQFTQWMIATEGSYWTAYCKVVGRNPCTQTSSYPVQPKTAMQGIPGDSGVAGYVSQAGANGAIGYVEYSYALATGFPVAKVLNAAGYYTEPTPGHVAVSLLKAQINMDKSNPALYLTQNLSQVYADKDPRTYELSSYSYMIIPTDTTSNFTTDKGYTLGAFGEYALCVGQSQVDSVGYSALPINLVEDGFDQLRKIPGSQVPVTDLSAIQQCHNPTFSTNGTNTLADNDPYPPACDHQGRTQCSTATGGAGGGGGSGGGNGNGTGNGTGNGNGNGTGNGTGSGTGSGTGTGTTHGTTTGSSTSTTTGSSTSTTAGGTGPSCDPNTGICSTPGTNAATGTSSSADSGQPVGDNPIALAASNGDGVEVTLMALAAGLLFFLGVGPPLIAQGARRRRQRRGVDEYYGDADRPGEGR